MPLLELPAILAQAASSGGRSGNYHAMLDAAVRWTTMTFEFLGIVVIVIGTIWAFLLFAAHARLHGPFEKRYSHLRANIGRAILLGLEILVAADIINTVAVDPTLRSVAVLGVIVLIRTFLSFSLEVEINGRWPWQENRREEAR